MKSESVIRENDYYGGDLLVECREKWNDCESEEIAIVWDSWGRYGGCEIVLALDEAAKLRDSLTQMLSDATTEGAA